MTSARDAEGRPATGGSSRTFNERSARIDLEGLTRAAGELQLDDPVKLLKTLSRVQGGMVCLRAYAKRRIAEQASDDELAATVTGQRMDTIEPRTG